MKIKKLRIEGLKGLKRLEMEIGGGNASVTGENGTGKTSIVDAVSWLLTNKLSNGKSGEVKSNAGTETAVVEIEYDSGLKLRRELGSKNLYFVNGAPQSKTSYEASVGLIFKGAATILMNPLNFCKMHYSERRQILLKLFGGKEDEKQQGIPPEQIIKQASYELRQLEKESATIPARIDELQKTLKKAVRIDIEKTQAEAAANAERISELQRNQKSGLYEQALKLERDALETERQVAELRAQFCTNEIELSKLRKQYSEIQSAMNGQCPTCGAKVESTKKPALQAKLNELVVQGKELAEKQEAIKGNAAKAKAKVEELKKAAAAQKKQAEQENDVATELQKALLERERLQKALAEAQRNAEIEKRIEELKAREEELGVARYNCDKQIYQATDYINTRMRQLEETINSHFELVRFQMFQPFKVAEGVRECCEPFMNGVPYFALSKGEQLKASLDILKALQKAYGVEMPIFIDDAESYTSNSFVNIPNQVILLKAAEGVKELQVQIH